MKLDAVNVSWRTTQISADELSQMDLAVFENDEANKVSPGHDVEQKLGIIRQDAVKPIHWQIQMTEFMAYPARK